MANKKEINPKSGKRLKELLKRYKITQEAMSEKLGCSVQHMSQMVTGRRRLTEDTARKIADMFPPTTMEWLMGWEDWETEYEKAAASLWDTVNSYRKYTETVISLFRLAGYDIILRKTDDEEKIPPEQVVDGEKGEKKGYRIERDGQILTMCTWEEMMELIDEIGSYAEYKLYRFIKKKKHII